MKVSLSWLADYVDITGVDPAVLAEKLTNAGLEVESVDSQGAVFSGVLVGKVLAVKPHPNADRLRLATVDIGSAKNEVVCGAPNLAEGQLIAYAQLGAKVLSGKTGELFTLGPAQIRGVESCGMICSLEELGLTEAYAEDQPEGKGIWVLNTRLSEAAIGQPLEAALGLATDTVLHTAPTANRGDQMSMVGVAREVAALMDRPTTFQPLSILTPQPSVTGYSVQLNDPSVCTYYGAVVLDSLVIQPSPAYVQQRLQAAGVRAISNVVDVTNYVMLEMGQPLHAFDGSKLKPGVLSVRKATPGETLETLDDETRTLTHASVVVTLDDSPVALAGVMGGASTQIDDGSKTLVLEGAYFPPASNRRNAKSVGLRSESSARFERGVDGMATRQALFRAVELLQDWAQAKVVGFTEASLADSTLTEALVVPLRSARMTQIIGAEIPDTSVSSILEKLGFKIVSTTGTSASDRVWSIEIPSYRRLDVTREIDLIEEVIRVYGYDQVPNTLPQKSRASTASFRQEILEILRETLTASGLFEATTHSLIGEPLLARTGFTIDRERLVQVTNSHSQDHVFLRQSVLPTLIEVVKSNLAQGNEAVHLFELGRIYTKDTPSTDKNSGVTESLMLSGVMTGPTHCGTWQKGLSEVQSTFYTMKGVLDQLLETLNLSSVSQWNPLSEKASLHPSLHPGQGAILSLNTPEGKVIELGTVGQLHPQWQEQLKLRQPVYVFELAVEPLIAFLKGRKQSQSRSFYRVSPYPAVKRDLAFSVPQSISHQAVLQAIQALNNPLLHQIELFDEYVGEQLGQNLRSLAYRFTLQSPTETLTDATIDAAMADIRKALNQTLSVNFR